MEGLGSVDLGLRERVAIVGGSSRGVGRAIALGLAHEGASVTICAQNDEALKKTEIELARVHSQHHVLAIPADISTGRDIRRVVRDTYNRFDQINILVTQSGTSPNEAASELEDESIALDFERNFYSAIRLSREVIPYMKQQHWGRIINLFSSPFQQSDKGLALASSSQQALIGYFKSLSNELAPFNITVNNVIFGPVDTEQFASQLESRSSSESKELDVVMKESLKRIPMGRLGKPEEIADLVSFLASDRASFLTGGSTVIDGGMLQTIR